ncbi:hypothetical protein [Nocardia gipuzkoensis]|uniref:hypothetical protein n=1 Tax=Nocardia gipuzkoensis TaxID=2749991 RepID=UPI0015EF862D|nr:hypothetical protein [Nocardia gipuzkoensis]
MLIRLTVIGAAIASIALGAAGTASAENGYHWFPTAHECQASYERARAHMTVYTGCEQYFPEQHRYPIPDGKPGWWYYTAR